MKGHHLRSSLPRFPGKKSKLWTNHGDQSFVEDRRVALEQYMKTLLQVRGKSGSTSYALVRIHPVFLFCFVYVFLGARSINVPAPGIPATPPVFALTAHGLHCLLGYAGCARKISQP